MIDSDGHSTLATLVAPLPAALQLEHVVKRYPGDPPLEVLHDVSLRIDTGELVAIVGPSGSGKTTLLHIMGTLERATVGQVRISGEEVGALSDGELSGLRGWRLGFVFQQFFLLDSLTALENVAQGLLYRGVPARDRRRRAEAMLVRVGLGHRLDHQPRHLSGGERQRVAIARALVGDPAVILADEPTGNVDSTTGAGLMALLQGLNRDGITIVIITHDAHVAGMASRQIELLDGRIRPGADVQ